MSATITPTPGRIVHYYPADNENLSRVGNDPLAAIVCGVVDDHTVHLSVFDAGGNQQARRNVRLQQPGEDVAIGSYACWMPYQINAAGIKPEAGVTSFWGGKAGETGAVDPMTFPTILPSSSRDYETSGYAVVVDIPPSGDSTAVITSGGGRTVDTTESSSSSSSDSSSDSSSSAE